VNWGALSFPAAFITMAFFVVFGKSSSVGGALSAAPPSVAQPQALRRLNYTCSTSLLALSCGKMLKFISPQSSRKKRHWPVPTASKKTAERSGQRTSKTASIEESHLILMAIPKANVQAQNRLNCLEGRRG